MRTRLSSLSFIGVLLFSTLLSGACPTRGYAETPRSFLAPNAESYVFNLEWGGFGDLNDEFKSPEGIAVDPQGNLWVADQSNSRIMKFDANGNFLFSFGAPGSGDGQFSSPHGIAIDRLGNVWVADTFNNRVQKFNANGAFLCKAGGLTQPHGIAVHPTNVNTVYVANTGANAIRRFTGTCTDNGGWGSGPSANDGEFNFPHDIAVDASGKVYVADYNNNRIQVFNATGATLLDKWGVSGSGDSRFTAEPNFSGPAGIEVDACGYVFVSDHNNNRIQKFTSDGTFVTMWGWSGNDGGEFARPVGVAADGKGRVFVADRDNHRIQRFAPSTQDITYLFSKTWGAFGSTDGAFSSPMNLAVDPTTGTVYVADTFNHRIQVFNASGTFQRKWGAFGSGDGQFSSPRGLVVHENEVYVADQHNHRIQVFSPTGVFKRKWGSNGNANGQLSQPLAVAVDPNTDEVYVAEFGNHRIQKFAKNGTFLRGIGHGTTWTGAAPSPAASNLNRWFNGPAGVAVDRDSGDIYVADYHNNRIQKFSGDGAFLTKWGASGSTNGLFSGPVGIAVDADGDVYVGEQFNHRIQKFEPNGKFITKWGSHGSGAGALDGLFSSPQGVALNNAGNFLYVADVSNHRIQRFERFGFSFTATPATQNVVKGNVGTYNLSITGVGPNTLDAPVTFCLLSGKPGATTAVFAPASVIPNAGGPETATLTLDTSPTTPAKSYPLFIIAQGGGQTRVRAVTLKVTNP
jgi:DNA-binding beta-propeller fold protein YncE